MKSIGLYSLTGRLRHDCLVNLMPLPPTGLFIYFIAEQSYQALCESPGSNETSELYIFIRQVVRSANVPYGTLATAAVYLRRVQLSLSKSSREYNGAPKLMFLVILIIAAKYFNDVSPTNQDWSRHSDYSRTDIDAMERQILTLLEWHLSITTDELYFALDKPLSALISYKTPLACFDTMYIWHSPHY